MEHLRIASFEKNEAVNMENASRKGRFMNDVKDSNKFIRKGTVNSPFKNWKHFSILLTF